MEGAAAALARQVGTKHLSRAPSVARWMELQLERPRSWPGACAFCAFAEGQAPGAAPSCRGVRCPGGVRLAPALLQRDVVCFDNHHEPADRLCILRDFREGRSNVEAIPPADRERALLRLLQGVARDAELRGKALPSMLCLNPERHSSVPWTHVHSFEKGLNPDGGVEDRAYCVEAPATPLRP